MRLRFGAIVPVLTLAAATTASPARAQQLVVPQAASLPRLDANNKDVGKRPLALNPEGISLQDCRDDIRLRISYTATGFVANDRIEVWAARTGQDCGQVTQRSGATQRCWKVVADRLPRAVDELIVPVRAIIADDFSQTGTPVTPSADICGKIDLATFQLQILFLRPSSGENAVTKVDVSIKADTVGPPALSGVRTLPGDTRLRVTWDSLGEGGVTDQTGVRVYCVPAGGSGEGGTTTRTETVCDDAGTDDADLDGGAPEASCREVTVEVPAASGDCTAAAFTPQDGGSITPDNDFNAKYLCGEIAGNFGSSALAQTVGGQPLVNGTRYAVAVAATDSFSNVGTLSAPVCAVPEETTDFFRDYKRSGGGATGCATTPSELPAGTFAIAGVSFALVVSRLRRRARGRSR